jgi:hypothetical protein
VVVGLDELDGFGGGGDLEFWEGVSVVLSLDHCVPGATGCCWEAGVDIRSLLGLVVLAKMPTLWGGG